MTTTVVRRGRDEWVRRDQPICVLWLFALGNSIGYAKHISRGQEPGHASHTPRRGLRREVTHEK